MFLNSNIIFAGKDQESSTSQNQEISASKNNQKLYEYYQNEFFDERIKKSFLKLINFFNERNFSLNQTICQLILRCDTRYRTTFMYNIRIFFTHAGLHYITLQQFSEWFNDDPQKLKKFSIIPTKHIKQIVMHDLFDYLPNLYKGFGFPNIDEVNIVLRKHQDCIEEQEKIVRDIVARNIKNTRVQENLFHDPFNFNIDELTKFSHLLLTHMHGRNIVITSKFLLWMGRIPYHLFERTCKKMLVFLNKLANPFKCDTIVDMISSNHIDSFAFCDDNEIEYIASLDKINDIMMIQQGRGFPSGAAVKYMLEIEEIETIWPKLRLKFKECGFPKPSPMFLFLKKNDQYNEKIQLYIRLITSNNPHIKWDHIEINALHSMLYFLLSKNVKDILLLSHIFYNVSQNCSAVIYKIMKFINFLDDNLINIRKLSGMLYFSNTIHMFIELPHKTLQLLAKYEKSHDIMNFFQEENSGLLKKLTEIVHLIHKYSYFTTTYNNPEFNKQFTKLKIYWGIYLIAINLDKEKVRTQWHTNIERDFIPIFEALLKNNIIIHHRLYEILFNKRKHRSKLCKKLVYLFSHHAFSQFFFEFFMNLLDDDDNYLNFMRCSNEDFENFLTNKIPYHYHGNFYFLKKLLKNYNINDANAICTHQTDAIQHMQFATMILSTHQLLMHEYKNDEKSISCDTVNKLLHNPCWKDEKGNFDLHRLCAVSNMFSLGCARPFDSNEISTMLNWSFMQKINGSINYSILYIISFLCFGHGLPDKEKAQKLQIWLMMNSEDEQLSLSILMLKMPMIGMGLNIATALFNYDEKVRSLMRKHSLSFGASDYLPLKKVSLYLLFHYVQINNLENRLFLIKGLVEKKHKMIPKSKTLEFLVSSMEHEMTSCAH